MIVDSSAIIAILFNKPDAAVCAAAIANAPSCRVSAANCVEAAKLVESQSPAARAHQFDIFMRRAGIVSEPLTEEHALLAQQACADFGKCRHPASLNFGDCFSCVRAMASGELLLFKGHDFSQTDVKPFNIDAKAL